MTRAHTYDPPPHLAAAFHTHICSRGGHEYPCYASRHTRGSVRFCGSPSCKEAD